jgi:hypothetical protein
MVCLHIYLEMKLMVTPNKNAKVPYKKLHTKAFYLANQETAKLE